MQQLLARRKEHLVMNMFAQRNNNDYVDMNRPEMLLRNHNGTKFKTKATRNHKVYKSPYYGVFNYGNDFQMQHGHCMLRRSSNKVSKV